MSDEYDKSPVDIAHDGYWQAIPPKLRYPAQMAWDALPGRKRQRYESAVQDFAARTGKNACLDKIRQTLPDARSASSQPARLTYMRVCQWKMSIRVSKRVIILHKLRDARMPPKCVPMFLVWRLWIEIGECRENN